MRHENVQSSRPPLQKGGRGDLIFNLQLFFIMVIVGKGDFGRPTQSQRRRYPHGRLQKMGFEFEAFLMEDGRAFLYFDGAWHHHL